MVKNRYIYISREQAKNGVALVFAVRDSEIENQEEYFGGKACLFTGENLPHYITYLPEKDTVREATEEEKLERNQRKLASNEFVDDDGKIVSYDTYSQKVEGNKVVEKTREDYMREAIITLSTERDKCRFERNIRLKAVDLYDKAVLRGDIVETSEMKLERDTYRKEWLTLPANYINLEVSIEESYPKTPEKIAYFKLN